MKILSLFDGMSVAQQAISELYKDYEYYASEIDEYAIAVTQSNFPKTKQIGSVTDIQIDTVRYNKNLMWKIINGRQGVPAEDFDLLIGGSPCQDLSIAKKDRKGLDGERSGLFFEYVRIRDEVKPKYFILENVNSMPKESKDKISEILGVQPVMINASLVSAQNRKRLFWVGKLDEFGTYQQVDISQPEDRGILLKDILEENVDESYQVNACSFRGRNIVDGKRKDILGAKTEQRLEIGGEKANTITSVYKDSMVRIGQFNSGGQGDRVYSQEGKSVALSAQGGGRGAKTGLYLVGNVNPSGKGMNGAVHNVIGKSPTINTNKGEGQKIYNEGVVRKLTPTECLRLQSMPDNYFDKAIYKGKPISNSQRYKMCGNAFNCQVIVHILKHLK